MAERRRFAWARDLRTWRKRVALAAAALAAGGALGALLWLASRPPSFPGKLPSFAPSETAEAATAMRRPSLLGDLTAKAGLRVEDVFVLGRERTPRAQLLQALDVERGAPILDIDLNAARARVLALPWVAQASVERLLPGAIVLRITERRPIGLWQRQGRYAVIDREGKVISQDGVQDFDDLLLVVGEGAEVEAATLIDMLSTEPELRREVRSAVRVGGRRWNLRFANGVDVRLPEQDPLTAWRRLAEYQRVHGLLGKNVRNIDMRFADRLVLQPREPSETETAATAARSTEHPRPIGTAEAAR